MEHFKPYYRLFERAAAVFFAFASLAVPPVHEAAAAAGLPEFSGASGTVFRREMESFSPEEYRAATAALFSAFEAKAGRRISPGAKGKVGIKVYTNSGPGNATPANLVRAVVMELEKRGYSRGDVCIVDMSRMKMRSCGFLPKYADLLKGVPDDFEGSPVVDIDSGSHFSPDWFYDNPLMPRGVKYALSFTPEENAEARKSYLPVPLFLTVDFWINLPTVTDMEGIGVCGALGNATVWNMSNSERFLAAPANAPVAVAEVAAIPELSESLLFSIMSFERAQYVGGAIFNAGFTVSVRELLLSSDPVALDFIALNLINRSRTENGFDVIEPIPPVFDYARQLEIGDFDFSKIRMENAR